MIGHTHWKANYIAESLVHHTAVLTTNERPWTSVLPQSTPK